MSKYYGHHVLDIFTVDLWVTTSSKGWKKINKLVDNTLPESPDFTGGTNLVMHSATGSFGVVIYIDELILDQDVTLVNTIAHEAAHAARFILNHVTETESTSECEAYLVGWLAGWVFEWIKSNKEESS